MLGGEKSSGTKNPPKIQQQYKTKHKNQKKKHTTKEPHDVQTMGI